MHNKKLFKLVRNRPEKYPYLLERDYGRILDRILELWGTPHAEQYFLDLLVDGRGNRTGFPLKAAEEIYFLSELHSLSFDDKGESRIKDETARVEKADRRAVEFRAVLEQRGFKFVPSEMFSCISRGDFDNLVMFVNAGMGVDTRNERGWTPLMVALFEGQEKVALFLIRRGADPFFQDSTGYRPVHWAAFHGYVTVIRELAERGADLNARTKFGWSPLLQAAARGYAPAVDTLLDLGARIDASDTEGWTALHKACANGHLDVVATLLLHHANINSRHTDGRTPLLVAIEQEQRVIAAMLLKHGADPNAAEDGGMAPMHVAAAKNEVALIDLLLSSGARRSVRDGRGVTPLMYAVETGAIAAIRRLIAAGARITETLDARAQEREAAASRTAEKGRVLSSVGRLVKSVKAGRGSRLHEAVARNDVAAVRKEIAGGADINGIGQDGLTPLEIAAAHGHLSLWGVLIDLGAGRRADKVSAAALASTTAAAPTTAANSTDAG